MLTKRSILICGGGTGGHFFSGVAAAELLLEKYPDVEVLFVGTRQGIEARYPLPDARMRMAFIHAKGLKGKKIYSRVLGLAFSIMGVLESAILLLRERPKYILGVGGYASAPTLLAGWLMRPFFRWQMSILEQNSSAGLVNRIFSYLEVRALSAFPIKNFETIDLPLRKALRAQIPSQKKRKAVWPPKKILLVGGSQGSRGLNAAWKKTLPHLHERISDLKICHQTGAADEREFQALYRDLGISAEVFAFTDEMPRYYADADLIICRSGAMTVFEVMAFERPTIFVPFPHAADDHQRKNAESVQQAKWIVRESEWTWPNLQQLLSQKKASVPARSIQATANWGSLFDEVYG